MSIEVAGEVRYVGCVVSIFRVDSWDSMHEETFYRVEAKVWVEASSQVQAVTISHSYEIPESASVDATPEVLAKVAAFEARVRHEEAMEIAARQQELLCEAMRDAWALLAGGFKPAVKVKSTRSKVAFNTAGRAVVSNETYYQGHLSHSILLALSPEVDARGRHTNSAWLGESTLEVIGSASVAELCWAAAAVSAGYDPEDALQVFATLASVTLPLPEFRIVRERFTVVGMFNVAAWVAAVKQAMGDSYALDNAERVEAGKVAIETSRKAAAKEKAAAKAAEKAAAKAAKRA